jgi:hypothetical protein
MVLLYLLLLTSQLKLAAGFVVLQLLMEFQLNTYLVRAEAKIFLIFCELYAHANYLGSFGSLF